MWNFNSMDRKILKWKIANVNTNKCVVHNDFDNKKLGKQNLQIMKNWKESEIEIFQSKVTFF